MRRGISGSESRVRQAILRSQTRAETDLLGRTVLDHVDREAEAVRVFVHCSGRGGLWRLRADVRDVASALGHDAERLSVGSYDSLALV